MRLTLEPFWLFSFPSSLEFFWIAEILLSYHINLVFQSSCVAFNLFLPAGNTIYFNKVLSSSRTSCLPGCFVQLFRRALTGWRSGQRRTLWNSIKANAGSCTSGRITIAGWGQTYWTKMTLFELWGWNKWLTVALFNLSHPVILWTPQDPSVWSSFPLSIYAPSWVIFLLVFRAFYVPGGKMFPY